MVWCMWYVGVWERVCCVVFGLGLGVRCEVVVSIGSLLLAVVIAL